MLLDITDPNDSSVRGTLSSPDAGLTEEGFVNLIISDTVSSEDVKTLFDLTPPPSFNGPFMVWGELDQDSGALVLFLATTTGDRTHPFATLDGFRDVVESGAPSGSGSGTLSRSNKLPPDVSWQVSP